MFTVTEAVRERTLCHEDIPVLTLSLRYPTFTGGTKRAAARLNAFYAHMAQTLDKRAERKLLPLARAALIRAIQNGRTFREYRVRMTYKLEDDGDSPQITRTLCTRISEVSRERTFTDSWDPTGCPTRKSNPRRESNTPP
ncbi:MAG: hypothetical protein LBT36_01895 [Oscillospiraceae bacterium]|jgi:hypothetical protein|nr:hypothetical protein [Oscillospiraceae bacterium]